MSPDKKSTIVNVPDSVRMSNRNDPRRDQIVENFNNQLRALEQEVKELKSLSKQDKDFYE